MAAAASSTYISIDLVEDILVRLPVKSILRFKSVSRRWKSSIESQRFVQRHAKNSRRKILLALDSDGGAPSPFLSREEEEEEEMWYIRNCDASVASLTCDGLICIPRSDSIEVSNPATRESRRFPPGEPLSPTEFLRRGKGIPVTSLIHISRLEDLVPRFPTYLSTFGFGKDEVTGTYKVVELRGNKLGNLVHDCNVLDLETGQWRQLGVVPHRIYMTERSVYVNGSVHWFTIDVWELDAPNIVAFDLHTEEFRAISYPNFALDPPFTAELLSLGENRLSVSEMRPAPDVHLHIWTMVDDERWVKMHSICLCRLYNRRGSSLQLFTPVLISKQGDGVFFFFLWDYKHTLFKSSTNTVFTQKISTDARVVTSSYIPTLVPVPVPVP